jgi:outer membrane receptor for ferric coprogen and ferric-rhodotorulic acid
MHDNSERFNFYSRGFALSNFQYDGVPTQDFTTNSNGLGLRDMAIYDRVEVMGGVGSPAGVVNLVRKRPTKTFQGYVSGSAGSWDRYRTEADLAGPLSDNGALRGRVVAVYETGNNLEAGLKSEFFSGALNTSSARSCRSVSSNWQPLINWAAISRT